MFKILSGLVLTALVVALGCKKEEKVDEVEPNKDPPQFNNPIITNLFTADLALIVLNDIFYIYICHD
tara:strand:+ start:151 stop:351 length:201 start_codon:yes stop_codon:yes gene_type:complete